MKERMIVWILTMVGIVWACGEVYGQTGAMSGIVRDERGDVVAGAEVRVRHRETGEVRQGKTDEGGRYSFPALRPGTYEVEVEARGFQRTVQTGIVVSVGGSVQVDVVLRVGEVVEQVTVTGEISGIEPTRVDVSRVIEGREILDLPILGRNFVDFVKLSSRVAIGRGDLTGGAFQEPSVAVGSAAAPRLTFGGMNERLTLLQVDGVDHTQTITGLPRATPSQEAVQEFRVLHSTYAAEFGRFAAGMVNIVTRSGTGEYHGGVYYFGMNDALNARSILQQPGAKTLRQHQFGAVLGGPLGRAFFFSNYEGQRRAEANNFSEVILRNLEAINRVRRGLGLSEEVSRLLKVNNYDQFLVRGDGSVGGKHQVMGRYNFLDSETRNFLGGGGRASPTSSTRRDALLRDQGVMMGVTSVLASTWVNEVRFQWGRRRFEFPARVNEPALEIPNLIIMGKSTSDVDFYREGIVQWVEQMTVSRGAHEVKVGMNGNHYRDRSDWALFFPARVIFPGLGAFLGLPPFQGPTPVLFQWPAAVGWEQHPGLSPRWDRAVPQQWEELIRLSYTWESWGVFVQDRWRVSPRFTFSYGLRYDFDTLPRRFADRDYDNVQPRVGIAYSFREGKGVIRAGFGIFHDVKRSPAHWLHAQTVLGWGVETPLWDLGPFTKRLSLVALRSLVGPAAAAPAFQRMLQTGQFPPSSQGVIWTHPPKRDLRTPYSEQASLEIGYEWKGWGLSASYLMVHGLRIPQAHGNLNAFRTGTAPDGRPLFAGRRDPRYLAAFPPGNDDRSNYHGGTFEVKRRMGRGMSLTLSYTVSKTITLRDPMGWGLDISQFPVDPTNENLERSLSNQHVGQRFVGTFLGEGPRERLRGILRDFKLGVIVTAEGPRYSTVYAGVDANQDGNPSSDRPGQLGKNTFKGDRFVDVGVRVARTVSLGERMKLEALMEFFNLFNTVNVKAFNTVWGSADLQTPPPPILAFGTPKDVFPPRQIQYAVKINF